MSDELHYLSATEAIAHFRARELSPVELLQAIIDRTQKFEPHINAFTEEMFDEALAGARDAESRYRGQGPDPRPLEGIPVAAKEKHSIAGKSLTEGSLAGRGNIARENAPVIDRVLAAGGLIHARTTTPEFCVAAFTHSPLWGVTRNPWNLDYSPGGSSGGAGAALAAGTTTLATASDIGGSTRGPAGFTGTVGLKASYGRIAGVAPLSMDSYRGDGPMARTVDDAILLANVLIGPDPRDHSSLRPAITLPHEYPSVEGMRIALCLRLGDFPIEPDIEANTRALAQSLVDAGAIVEEIELPWTRDSMAAAVKVHFETIMGASVAEVARVHGDLLADYTLDNVAITSKGAAEMSFLDGLRKETQMQRELAEAMAPFDALICPTSGTIAFPAGESLLDGLTVAGQHVNTTAEALLTLPFNVANRCPVLAVPSGHAHNGVPTGVQIVGHTYDEPTVFRIGKALEKIRPWAYTDQHQPKLNVVTPASS